MLFLHQQEVGTENFDNAGTLCLPYIMIDIISLIAIHLLVCKGILKERESILLFFPLSHESVNMNRSYSSDLERLWALELDLAYWSLCL